jgi:hypothetical protein
MTYEELELKKWEVMLANTEKGFLVRGKRSGSELLFVEKEVLDPVLQEHFKKLKMGIPKRRKKLDPVYIPVGKALMAVEKKDTYSCMGCYFFNKVTNIKTCSCVIECYGALRKDGKNVRFVLVDVDIVGDKK